MNREFVLCANGSEAKFAVGPIKYLDPGDVVKVDGDLYEVKATYRSYADDELFSFLQKAEDVYPITGWWKKDETKEAEE